MIPPLMFKSFRTGIEKWGTVCGSLVPAIALIGCVVEDDKIRTAMVNELLAWYSQHPFPEYQPAGLGLTKLVVGSPMCHISVSLWCNAQGVSASSKEKKQRCAGVSADVTKKTIEMLDSFTDTGTFVAVHAPDPIVATCMECHSDSAPYAEGKDNCLSCHGAKLKNIEDDPNHKELLR